MAISPDHENARLQSLVPQFHCRTLILARRLKIYPHHVRKNVCGVRLRPEMARASKRRILPRWSGLPASPWDGSVQQSRSAPYLIFLDESLRAASDYSVPQAVLVPHGAGSSKIVVQPDASNIRRELDPMSKWLPRDREGPGIEKIVGRYFFRAEV